jgi:hypothetical protein
MWVDNNGMMQKHFVKIIIDLKKKSPFESCYFTLHFYFKIYVFFFSKNLR